MNIQLLEILIKDFKGVAGTHVLKLSEKVTFLSGANGYGKTTIFDAVELALTGIIERVEALKSYEDGHKRHRGSILHNHPKNDIEIRLALSVDGETKTIVAYCPAAEESATSPVIDWGRFSFQLLDNEGNVEGGRDEIDSWLPGVKSGYRLFTYLQQSDSTFFLKQAQKQRHTLLNPLLDIGGAYEAQIEDMGVLRARLDVYRKHLKAKEKGFDSSAPTSDSKESEYVRLIEGDIIHDFDEFEPFKGLGIDLAKAEYSKIMDKIDEIQSMLDNFIPDEYVKNEQHKYLSRFITDQDFLTHASLKKYIDSDAFVRSSEMNIELSKIANDNELLKRYVLKNFFERESFHKMENLSHQRSSWQKIFYPHGNISGKDIPNKTEKILKEIIEESNDFNEEWREKAKGYLERYLPLNETSQSVGLTIIHLNETRDELLEQLKIITSHKAVEHIETNCPFCGTNFETYENLIQSIENKSWSLEKLMNAESKRLQELVREIEDGLFSQIRERIAELKETAEFFDQLERLKYNQDITADTELIPTTLKNADSYVLNKQEIPSKDEVDRNVTKLRDDINKYTQENHLGVMRLVRNLHKKDYSTYYAVLERLGIDYSMLSLPIIDEKKAPSVEHVELCVTSIRDLIKGRDDTIVIRPEAILSEHVRIYKELFSTNQEKFNAARGLIDKKKVYISKQFETAYLHAKVHVSEQLSQIQLIMSKIDKFKDDYRKALRIYQDDLTKALQLPFYVYSAKILQNTPQCQGVFMVTQAKSGTIVFTPEQDATHDIAGQLSAGQLVVVAMAFYLAMNSVFPESSTGVMAIDDPIQDLDVLNMHSFTELMRREFIGKYQVLMSTHDNNDMKYMTYKFNTGLESNLIKTINVQSEFFGAIKQEV